MATTAADAYTQYGVAMAADAYTQYTDADAYTQYHEQLEEDWSASTVTMVTLQKRR